MLLFKRRPKLVPFSGSDQWRGDLPLPPRPGLQEHAGHPLRDELRPRVPAAGEDLNPVPRQQALVRHRLLPQYVEAEALIFFSPCGDNNLFPRLKRTVARNLNSANMCINEAVTNDKTLLNGLLRTFGNIYNAFIQFVTFFKDLETIKSDTQTKTLLVLVFHQPHHLR